MVAVVVFLVLASLRVLVFTPETATSPDARQSGTVRQVIDGDTFDLTDGRRIRMLGIDAPEAGFHGGVAEPHSAESTAWLRDRIEGRRVQLRIGDEEFDRYGRTLAWIYDSQGMLINQQMLSEGQARLLADFGLPLDLEPSLRQAESEARLSKRGIWKNSPRRIH
jgi:endonuclease YncB( thermonuclease family)